MSSSLAIVVIGYNRKDSINRLLNSLSLVDYGSDNIDLIISIDNSGKTDVENYANEYNWKYGKKIVKTFKERLGLRKHILACGEFLCEYDAIAILEDDIYVSKNFYRYMKETVEFYKDNEEIAGISLYNHSLNVLNGRPFLPAKSRYDVFFLQFAQSWGQIWLKKQWFEFKKWYEANYIFEENSKVPQIVSNWPNSSWLKYHIKYCVEKNKYFVYPYFALSTCFTDVGEHNIIKSTSYQIPMLFDTYSDYKLAPVSDLTNSVFYDVFFERLRLGEAMNINDSELCVDLYGEKEESLYRKYLITMKKEDFKILKSYNLELRPHEMNILLEIPGNEIFLYDTSIKMKNGSVKDFEILKYYYDLKIVNYILMIKVLLNKVKTKIFKIFL